MSRAGTGGHIDHNEAISLLLDVVTGVLFERKPVTAQLKTNVMKRSAAGARSTAAERRGVRSNAESHCLLPEEHDRTKFVPSDADDCEDEDPDLHSWKDGGKTAGIKNGMRLWLTILDERS